MSASTELRRAFKGVDVLIDGELYLSSPSHHGIWLPTGADWRLKASCRYHSYSEIPRQDCSCGIYATYSIDEALTYSDLVALVRPAARAWPHTHGWRAAAAVAELIALKEERYLDIIPDKLRARLVPWRVLVENQRVPLALEWEVP